MTGSSQSCTGTCTDGTYRDCTDGDSSTSWQAGSGDLDNYLIMNLNGEYTISSMAIKTPSGSGDYGFKTLKIYSSADSSPGNWVYQGDYTTDDCSAGRTTNHAGFTAGTTARYIKIKMEDHCGGSQYRIEEWTVMGTEVDAQCDTFTCSSTTPVNKGAGVNGNSTTCCDAIWSQLKDQKMNCTPFQDATGAIQKTKVECQALAKANGHQFFQFCESHCGNQEQCQTCSQICSITNDHVADHEWRIYGTPRPACLSAYTP